MKMIGRHIKRAGVGLLDFLLPPRCPRCSIRIEADGHLCGACWGQLKPITVPLCVRCGLPFGAGDLEGAECGACLREPPAFDWARAGVLYDDEAKSLILGLKYGGQGAGVPAMARMMAGALVGQPRMDIVVPVPLHPRRLFTRRFNQSQLIGRALSSILSLPLDSFILFRHRATPSQGTLSRKGRKRNVTGAFAVAKDVKGRVMGKRVLLVDDVLTTGATASACAAALKRAGAREVGLVVFARVKGPPG
ncbi:ComF family protein [Kordiimonas aestuarii]|uniref:ComF family protein n=1 Tax=Kordiimonas aestuarii TaxID=1005925 RepID=UPI0021D214F0|nr:ComF family protein [Kordiimonas aestuarii]